MPLQDPLVDTAWLAAHLDAPDVKVADATWFLPTLARDAQAGIRRRTHPRRRVLRHR